MSFTRSLVVLSILLFIGLFFTSAHMFLNAGSTPVTPLAANLTLTSGQVIVPEVEEDIQKENRDSFIATMKHELGKRASTIVVPAPVVTEMVDDSDTTEANESHVVQNRKIVWCDATILESQFLATWPTNVEVVEREGARLVVDTTTVQATASGTIPTPVTFMQFALHPVLRTEPSCLTNNYVGFTEDGRLIHNNDVILYQAYGPDTLIGYAFDGHPIYGLPDDASTLDECAGVETSAGYEYHIRADENFILGCFMSEPQSPRFDD